MQVLLVRHAIAFDRDLKRWPDDADRPLSARGLERGRRAARGLKALAPRPQAVLTSPAMRTRQTADLLRESAGWPAATVCTALAPGSAVEETLSVLRRSRATCIALVGHEPDLGELMSACLGAGHDAFALRKMGAALVEFRGAPRPAAGRLAWLLAPRQLRAAA
ncbi:MAG: histidine phosphatase family protein [Proteobacteria bacterium]|nr:histidine phosphatase family protein [Pseudomonadota bacterium]